MSMRTWYKRPLTHWGLVTHMCQWSRSSSSLIQVMAYRLRAPSHCLTQYWLIVNWTPRKKKKKKKLQWNSNQNSTIFIEQNAFENVVCSFSPNCRRLKVLTIPALHISVYFSCHQESLLWILMWEWYYVNARSYLYLCQWEPNMDWQGVMSTRVGELMSPRWPRYWHPVVFICCWTLCL